MNHPEVAIIGLGYVGLPLALQFARSGVHVLGIDIDPHKVEALDRGKSYISHLSGEAIRQQAAEGRFAATTDASRVRETAAVVICVPTPLN